LITAVTAVKYDGLPSKYHGLSVKYDGLPSKYHGLPVIYDGISSNRKKFYINKPVLLLIETVILTKKSKNDLKNLSICSKNRCFCLNMPIDGISRIVWYASCCNSYSSG
jgi:hypothetical protein